MTNSLLNSLLTDLDTQSVSRIAGALREPEQSVLRGVKGSIAALLGALASKSEEPRILDSVMDLAPAAAETPGPPSETAHQASLRLDAQFPWLAAAFARRPTRRCRPDGTRGHLLAS